MIQLQKEGDNKHQINIKGLNNLIPNQNLKTCCLLSSHFKEIKIYFYSFFLRTI